MTHTPPTAQQLDEIAARAAALYEYATVTDQEGQDALQELTDTDVPALLAALRDSRTEIEKLIRWHREDETAMKRMRATIERLRGEKRELGELASRRESELISRRAALTEIRHLHKDSPMGPCPVCIDADKAAAGGDGLIPYPCPTGRLAGSQDCEPPHVRPAAVAAVAETGQ